MNDRERITREKIGELRAENRRLKERMELNRALIKWLGEQDNTTRPIPVRSRSQNRAIEREIFSFLRKNIGVGYVAREIASELNIERGLIRSLVYNLTRRGVISKRKITREHAHDGRGSNPMLEYYIPEKEGEKPEELRFEGKRRFSV